MVYRGRNKGGHLIAPCPKLSQDIRDHSDQTEAEHTRCYNAAKPVKIAGRIIIHVRAHNRPHGRDNVPSFWGSCCWLRIILDMRQNLPPLAHINILALNYPGIKLTRSTNFLQRIANHFLPLRHPSNSTRQRKDHRKH